ncbi:MAG TPA: hypothetical protein PKD26_15435 [Pyrinomonadaceae bacterium]|nr:hypothetical protein [Pyrinomonadaceae bacterium]
MKTLLLILLFLSFAVVLFGQQGPEKGWLKKPVDERFKTEYDKFKDVTVLRSPNWTVNQLEKNKTLLGTGVMFLVEYPGQEPKDAASYWLIITGMSGGGNRFESREPVIALVDGKRFNMRAVDRDFEIKRLTILSSQIAVTERIIIPMEPGLVDAFKTASKIEMQAGGTGFAVHDVALTVFKDMAGKIQK